MAGNTAHLNAVLPASAFAFCDRNSNTRLEPEEVSTCRSQLAASLNTVLALENEQGQQGQVTFSEAHMLHTHETQQASLSYVRLSMRYRWDKAPQALAVHYRQASPKQPLTVAATRTMPSHKGPQHTREPATVAVLHTQHAHHLFWGGEQLAGGPWQQRAKARRGVERTLGANPSGQKRFSLAKAAAACLALFSLGLGITLLSMRPPS
ncbi:MAG: hypothetical protein AAFS10_14325 [Myxococcota bacterium]